MGVLRALAAVTLAVMLGGGLPSSAGAQTSAAYGARLEEWVPLGHLAPLGASALAVSPDWPREGRLVALRGDAIIATDDAGQHWAVTGSAPISEGGRPGGTVLDLVFVGPKDSRALIARTDNALYRSTDLGQSWQKVLATADPLGRVRVWWPPDLGRDRLALARVDSRLVRSRDSGASWTDVPLPEGQVAQDVVFSPDYVNDNLVFVATAGGAFRFAPRLPEAFPPADPDSSLGVIVTGDGGDTWQERNAGLELEGEPFRAVQTLAISPTFAQDGTLFAIAWGGLEDAMFFDAPTHAQARALFMSTDRGVTWAPRYQLPSEQWANTEYLALSPTFARDGVAVWASSRTGPSPASSSCSVSRTDDGGLNWTVLLQPQSYGSCLGLALYRVQAHNVAVLDKDASRRWSDDGGLHWTGFIDGNAFRQLPVAIGSQADQTLFAISTTLPAGVYALGPDVQAASGAPACQFGTILGFDRVYRSYPEVRDLLGCALAPETNVSIQVADVLIGTIHERAFWSEDDDPDYWTTFPDGSAGRSPKRPDAWLQGPSSVQTVDGSVQRFEGGRMFFVPGANAQPGSIVVIGQSSHREYADTP